MLFGVEPCGIVVLLFFLSDLTLYPMLFHLNEIIICKLLLKALKHETFFSSLAGYQ
jgi:hypothetical protein